MIKKRHASPASRATWHLTLAGYQIIDSADTHGQRPSLKIDKPHADGAETVMQHGDKEIGSRMLYGCRVYWDVPVEIESKSAEES